MTLGQMVPRMSPARCAVSSLISLHHLPQRHLRLLIASSLTGTFLSVFKVFMRFMALAGVLIVLIAI
jgi:hypothetical protein